MAKLAYALFDPEDRKYFSALEKHLAPLRRNGDISVWSRDSVTVGDVEAQARRTRSEADFMIALITPDFLGSDPLLDEVTEAVDKGFPIIPILARPCSLEGTRLAGLRSLPKDDKPLETPGNDRAYKEVVEAIRAFLPILSKPRPDGTGSQGPAAGGSSPQALRSVIDVVPYPWSHPNALRLRDQLRMAYSVSAARFLAQTVPVDLGDWDSGGGVAPAWRNLIDVAAAQSKLRALIEKALSDPSIAGFHPAIREAIEPVSL